MEEDTFEFELSFGAVGTTFLAIAILAFMVAGYHLGYKAGLGEGMEAFWDVVQMGLRE